MATGCIYQREGYKFIIFPCKAILYLDNVLIKDDVRDTQRVGGTHRIYVDVKRVYAVLVMWCFFTIFGEVGVVEFLKVVVN